MRSDLLSTREGAERVGVSVATFCRWVEAGRITPTVRGAGVRGPMFFTPEQVDALAAERAS